MVYVTQFLLRWLYLNNLIRDRAEIQSLPQATMAQAAAMTGGGGVGSEEDMWKAKCLHGIASYPPGSTARLLALDSLRLEVVHTLATQLAQADDTIQSYFHKHHENSHHKHNDDEDDDDVDPFLDADLEIIQAFQKATSTTPHLLEQQQQQQQQQHDSHNSNDPNQNLSDPSSDDAILVIGPSDDDDDNDGDDYYFHNNNGYNKGNHHHHPSSQSKDDGIPDISNEEITAAKRLHNEAREYLPQLVSAVLHSPPMLVQNPQPYADMYQQQQQQQHQQLVDPLWILKKLLLTRCVRDPNLGIELCWLLEAEVGRAWKTLFEHRQQTGRRLIVVLPADKAAVIASIGIEKRSAFDLLQDAEQATAYGYTPHSTTTTSHIHPTTNYNNKNVNRMDSYNTPRLPASLSMRRCSHFGDTMHFIDCMSKISMDLQLVPSLQRTNFLQKSLQDLNRRLRRRMVTRGDVSLDVQQQPPPNNDDIDNAWPTYKDLTLDMLNYSIHFPLEPKSILWPPHDDHHRQHPTQQQQQQQQSNSDRGVMRVLNIVHTEARLLASRERCPYLVHLEVADTELEGSNARLYAAGAEQRLGATLSEILALNTIHKNHDNHPQTTTTTTTTSSPLESYHVPVELVSTTSTTTTTTTPSPPPPLKPNDIDKTTTAFSNDYETDEDEFIVETDNESDEDEDKDNDGDSKVPMADTINMNLNMNHLSTENSQQQQQQQNLPRGGWQSSYGDDNFDGSTADDHEGLFYPPHYTSTGDWVRQEQLEQLHQQMQHSPSHIHHNNNNNNHPYNIQPQPQTQYHQQQQTAPSVPTVTTRSALLDKVYGLPWAKKCEQIRQASPFGNVKGWRLASFIMKAGEDIRREALVMQVISKMNDWFQQDIHIVNNRPFLRPYTIMCVGGDAGLLECLPDAKSIDEVKKQTDGFTSLRDYFERAYGPPTTRGPHPQQQYPHPNNIHPQPNQDLSYGNISFEQAQDNFLRSLVGYSLVCYILQIKDRHNANILLDREGHIMHIDFGFVLGDTPKMGKVPLFSERAPFKLTTEFWDVIGGWNFSEGGLGVRFCKMFEEAFAVASSHSDELATLIEAALLNLTRNPREARSMANGVRTRLQMRGHRHSTEQKTFIMSLVNTALTSWGTSTYDWLQKSMNGYI